MQRTSRVDVGPTLDCVPERQTPVAPLLLAIPLRQVEMRIREKSLWITRRRRFTPH
jgi:hypothetical protein